MYYNQKKTLIDTMVGYDVEMIKMGEVVINENNGEVTLPDKKKHRKDRNDENETGKRKKRKEIIEILNDESTIYTNKTSGGKESMMNITTYQEVNKHKCEEETNEKSTRKQKRRELKYPFKRATEAKEENNERKENTTGKDTGKEIKVQDEYNRQKFNEVVTQTNHHQENNEQIKDA